MAIAFAGTDQVPQFDSNLKGEEALRVIPNTFGNLVNVNTEDTGLLLTFPNAEEGNQEIRISSRIYNPEDNGITFPRFVLQVSSFMYSQFDYEGKRLILNQNELLWLILYHRFQMLSENRITYTNLIRDDLTALMNYGEYNRYSTFNAQLKGRNSIAILNPWNMDRGRFHFTYPIGEYIAESNIDQDVLAAIMRDLPIQPGSESMAAKNKFVMYNMNKKFYSCAGYGMVRRRDAMDNVHNVIKTIFPIKPNVPARLKSHVISDAFDFREPSPPIFAEDVVKGRADATRLNAIVVFDTINEATGRLLCGEIECSEKFAREEVEKTEIVRESFKLVTAHKGKEISRNEDGSFTIGIDSEDNEVKVYGFNSVEVVDVQYEDVISDQAKVVLRCTRSIGSGRIFSNTGLKGVTKPLKDLGKIYVPFGDGNEAEMDVDLISGPNSTKAKGNTIALAKAALAHLLNCQIDGKDVDPIKSLDQELIKKLANQFGRVRYVDQNGDERMVLAGLVPVSVNELSYMFNNVRGQKFMPESAKILAASGYENLFEAIYEDGIDEEDERCVLEFQKILVDEVGLYAEEEELPVYSVTSLHGKKVFDENDLIFDLNPIEEYTASRILDEEYNKGFYLDLRYRGGGLIRFPSAFLINRFSTKLANGSFIYPMFLKNMSKVLDAIMKGNNGFLNKRNQRGGPRTLIGAYLHNIRQFLHTKRNFLEVLLKPKLNGVGMKQMADSYVPEGVMVVLDNHTYKKLGRKTGGFYQQHDFFRAFGVRNPVVWKSQVRGYDVWDSKRFALHLMEKHGVDMYRHFSVKYCKETLMMNPEDIVFQQSDVDGDLMPIFVPDDVQSQAVLQNFRNDKVLKEEIQWILNYRQGELESNSDFEVEDEHGIIDYEVYSLYYNSVPTGSTEPMFTKYFADSIIAKQDVGISTYNMWAIYALCEMYKAFCDSGKIKDSSGNEVKFTTDEMDYITYLYSRLVQDMVVRGIKHTEGGSAGFKPFLLENMIQAEYRKLVQNTLINQLGIPKEIVRSMFHMLHWGKETGYIKSIMLFISMHYKGKIPDEYSAEHFEAIRQNTFMGGLVEKIYEIHDMVKEAKDDGYYASVTGTATNFNPFEVDGGTVGVKGESEQQTPESGLVFDPFSG